MQRGIVWVVDDDSSIRWVLERALAGAGLSCTTFESGKEVLDALASKTPDVLLSDIRMPGMDGLTLLKQIKQRHPMLPVIIMTAHSDLDAAVSAYQQGAFDYLPKPFDIDEAVALVERAISHYQEQQQPRNVQINGPTTDIIGEAPAMQDVFRIIGRLSRSSISVLINGESGTGKELVAHALHRHAPLTSTQSSPNGRMFDQGSTFCIRVVRQRRVSTSSSNSRATSSRSEKPHITSRPVPGTGMEPLNPSPLNMWKPSGVSVPLS